MHVQHYNIVSYPGSLCGLHVPLLILVPSSQMAMAAADTNTDHFEVEVSPAQEVVGEK